MAGSLRGDPKTMSTRELDDLNDIVDGLDQRDRERSLIDREIPGLASLPPLGIARKHDLAGQAASQGVETDPASVLNRRPAVELAISRCPGVLCRVKRISAINHERDAIPSAPGVVQAESRSGSRWVYALLVGRLRGLGSARSR
jgi:hypothetical protein